MLHQGAMYLSVHTGFIFSPRQEDISLIARQNRFDYQPLYYTWNLLLSRPQKSLFLVKSDSGFFVVNSLPTFYPNLHSTLPEVWFYFIHISTFKQFQKWFHGGEPSCPLRAPILHSSIEWEIYKLLWCLNSLYILGLLVIGACVTLTNTRAIIRQRWLEKHSGNIVVVNWNPK